MHRRVSLLSIVFLAVHVLAAVFDPFTSLGIGAALVPLASSYRPLPIALGVIALYLFVALIATSLLRKHIGQQVWRLVHWSAYAMWPLAVLHGLTAGTDGWSRWMLAIDAVCVIAVALSSLAVTAGNPNRAAWRRSSPRRRCDPRVAGGTSDDAATPVGALTAAGAESLAAIVPGSASSRARAIHPGRPGARRRRTPRARRGRLPGRAQVGLGRRAGAGDAIVLVNGAEGEPLSAKDRVLMTARPHLVLDGAELAAAAVGARRIVLYVGAEHGHAIDALDRAVEERRPSAARAPRGSRWTSSAAALLHRGRGVRRGALRERGRSPADLDAAAPVRARRRRPPDARAERREPRPCGADRAVR